MKKFVSADDRSMPESSV